MSLLFDQNLSRKLPARLADIYPGCKHVVTEGLSKADDLAVHRFAASVDLAIVSKDSDFVGLAKMYGMPPKIIALRIGNCPTRLIEELLRARCVDVKAFLSDPQRAVLQLP